MGTDIAGVVSRPSGGLTWRYSNRFFDWAEPLVSMNNFFVLESWV